MALNVVMVTLLFSLLLFAGCQEDIFYRGPSTEVNGRIDNNTVVLGGLFPVHIIKDGDCGGIFDPGIQLLEAMVLATQSINNNSSLLPGVTLQFEIRDTCTFANKALEESLKYVCAGNSKNQASFGNETVQIVSGVVGAALSRSTTSVARLLRLFHIPQISYASTASVLSDKATFDYFFRTISPDDQQAQALADIIEYFNWTYVITMNTGDVYGRDGIRAFRDELDKRTSPKRCVTTSASIELQSDAVDDDFDQAIDKINEEWVRNATVVVLFVQQETAIGVLEAVGRRQRVDPEFALKNFTWIGSDGWGDLIPERLHEIAHGSLSIIPGSSTSEKFDDYFQSLHPDNYTSNPWFNEYWEYFFNCTLGNQQDLKQCDKTTSFSRASGYRQSSFVSFTIDAVYAFAHAIHNMQQDFCHGGVGLCQEILDTQANGVAVRGELLLRYLHNVSFSPGVSNKIINFDSNGDQIGRYGILNLRENSTGEFFLETIGQWDQRTGLKIFDEIQWSHGLGFNVTPKSICSNPCGNGEYREPIADQSECCWICKPCPRPNSVSKGIVCTGCGRGYTPSKSKSECILLVPNYLTWSHGWSIVITVLTILGIMATATIAVIFVVQFQHPVVKASSRELVVVLLTGIMLCYILPFFFIAKPSVWVCTIRRFSTGVCFALCYSALLVKTNRIHRIFNRPSKSVHSPPLISPTSQLFFTALLVCVQVVIAVIWLIAERPSAELVYYNSGSELVCGESPITGLFVALGYNGILLLVTIYFAFRTRKVPQNFNEAKFINLTVYSICILWLAFIPFYFGSAILGTIYQTGSLMLAIILNATVTLCTLFVPKTYFLFSRIRKGNTSVSGSFVTTRKTSNSQSQDQQKFSSGVSVCIPASINGSNMPTRSVDMPLSAQSVDNKDITEPPDSLSQL